MRPKPVKPARIGPFGRFNQFRFIRPCSLFGFIVAALILSTSAQAHPGSGILVDRKGNIFFLDTGSGIYRISPDGKLAKIAGPVYHWMAIDHDMALAKVSLPNFARGGAVVERSNEDPRIIVSSDFPVTVGPDGALYYGWPGSGEGVQVFRLAPSGKTETVKTLPAGRNGKPLGWLNGITAVTDGGIYYSEMDAIRRIGKNGEITTIADRVTVSRCDTLPEVEPGPGPYLRGFDVDSTGTIYVAATGCRAVLRIMPGKEAEVLLRSESPWSPTAVARSGNETYVLEYLHTPGDNRREWLPRVRKIGADGSIATIARIEGR